MKNKILLGTIALFIIGQAVLMGLLYKFIAILQTI